MINSKEELWFYKGYLAAIEKFADKLTDLCNEEDLTKEMIKEYEKNTK